MGSPGAGLFRCGRCCLVAVRRGADGNGNQTTTRSTTAYNARGGAASFTPAGNPANDQNNAGAGNGQRLTSDTTNFQPSPLSPAPARSKTGTTTTWAIRDPQGTLLALRIGTNPTTATAYYPFTDHLGSLRTLKRGDGTVANTYTYTAHEMTLTATEAIPQPYRYAQGYTDTTTGLIKLGSRWNDPTNGRFTQNDPTGQDETYLYAANKSITNTDPTGQDGSVSLTVFPAVLISRFLLPASGRRR